jgi:hypothetical protein
MYCKINPIKLVVLAFSETSLPTGNQYYIYNKNKNFRKVDFLLWNLPFSATY